MARRKPAGISDQLLDQLLAGADAKTAFEGAGRKGRTLPRSTSSEACRKTRAQVIVASQPKSRRGHLEHPSRVASPLQKSHPNLERGRAFCKRTL